MACRRAISTICARAFPWAGWARRRRLPPPSAGWPARTAASPPPARWIRLAAAPPTKASAALGRPGRVDRLSRIGRDVQHRAVVIGELAGIVHRMGFHELNHLQDAALAVDVRDGDIGFERIAGLGAVLE